MNDLLKQIKEFFNKTSQAWNKWKGYQKGIALAIVGAVILSVILLFSFNTSPAMVALIGTPIRDEAVLDRIALRLDEEGVSYKITGDNRIFLEDEKSARRMRSVLIREDLLPDEVDPWAIFDVERWTLTDFERDVNLRRAITKSVEQHINALESVDNVSVQLVMPEDKLFAQDQERVTASVILYPKPGSDIATNRKKVLGIQNLIQFAVEGLDGESITITDNRGIVLNDFAGLEEVDRIELAKKSMKTTQELESHYKNEIMQSLKKMFTIDRVAIIKVDITQDMNKRLVKKEEYTPIVKRPDNPETPYDESEYGDSLTISRSLNEEHFEGTNINPQGPPGTEGQVPPSYKDLQENPGTYDRSEIIENNVVNKTQITEERTGGQIERKSIAVAIDGIWKWKYNNKGEPTLNPDGSIQREYVAVEENDLRKAEELIKSAIGFDAARGDSVTVHNLMFDRTREHESEDSKYRSRKQLRLVVLYVIIGLGVALVSFIVFRMIARELERRRRLREEELARQHQAMREAALRGAEEEDSLDVEMSVEERARLEMQENAINMAREHPEDVAQLIRTWLMEEG